jgi:hypothetical protein
MTHQATNESQELLNYNYSLLRNMALPSFARATTSSALKSSPRSARTRDVTTSEQGAEASEGSPRMARKLKRPSTLTRRDRESIAYNADLYYIKPSNPSKPCPLAAIPSELRTMIYGYLFGDSQRPLLMNYGRERRFPSALLQVCRAIRIEAAYLYFTCTSFTWVVRNLDFSLITTWMTRIHPTHRALLARNQNLTIEIIPGLRKSYTYPPDGYLLDATMQDHWKTCQPFGNLYTVKGLRTHPATHDHVRLYFILLCRLLSWLDIGSKPGYSDIKWHYTFDMPKENYEKREMNESLGHNESKVRYFIQRRLGKLWVRNKCEDKVREQFLDLFDAFIEAYEKMEVPVRITYPSAVIVSRLKDIRRLVECW